MVLLNEPKKLIAITQDTSKNNFIHLRLYIFEHITLKAKRIYATYLAIFVNIFINDMQQQSNPRCLQTYKQKTQEEIPLLFFGYLIDCYPHYELFLSYFHFYFFAFSIACFV